MVSATVPGNARSKLQNKKLLTFTIMSLENEPFLLLLRFLSS